MSYRNIDTKETSIAQDWHGDPEGLLFAAVAPKNAASAHSQNAGQSSSHLGEARGPGTWAKAAPDCHMTLLTLVTWPH